MVRTSFTIVSEVYGHHWEDISVCAGLVSTATLILLVVFVPKVNNTIITSPLKLLNVLIMFA